MQPVIVTRSKFGSVVAELLKNGRLVAPVKQGETKGLAEISAENIQDVDLSGIRTVESFKSWVFKIIETVSTYFNQDIQPVAEKYIFLGVRACDLSALKVLDRVFLEGECVDPVYAASRTNIILITADCNDCGKTCFCNLVKDKPYAEQGFDLNISLLADNYLISAGSEIGEELLKRISNITATASDNDLQIQKQQRETVVNKLNEQNAVFNIKYELSGIHKINLENPAWRALTKDCVECSACNFICPSCSCFLLLDNKDNSNFQRDKVWDACLKTGYARVAGGSNSRPKLYERLQNRYHCKFDYSYDRLGRYTCVGCGRCIDACAGNIDMRKIFAALSYLAPLTAKLD